MNDNFHGGTSLRTGHNDNCFSFQGLSMRQIRFRFDGQPINETDTPAQLEMENEDTIDMFQQQMGGSRVASCLLGSGL